MGLKKNLYYEIKDVIAEERQDGIHAYKRKIRTKVYGLNSNKEIRRLLIDILMERVENHKDKIISPIIYNELLGMEIKRNGKVEHSNATHDDQVFSMLMALYVWYEGVNLSERFGLRKVSIKTDEDVDEQLDYYNDDTIDIVGEFNQGTEIDEEIEHDLQSAIKAGGIPLNEFLEKRRLEEAAQLKALIATPIGEKAYRQQYNIPDNVPISNYVDNGGMATIPDSVFLGFYDSNFSTFANEYGDVQIKGAVPEANSELLESEDYSYAKHFNF